VNKHLPWVSVTIRTNGFLIGKYAQELAQLKISRLEISVHGIAEVNNTIVQRQDSEELFQGIARLNAYLTKYSSPLRKMFCPVVSRSNVESIPALLEKAAELHVEEFVVEFCRYFPHHRKGESQLNIADSLYFHQEFFNQLMRSVKARADELGIMFYPTLFGQGVKHDQCCQPWTTMLVDWEGEVYPCTGGEGCFEKKVKSGEYHFCNLLKEDVRTCWNNGLYKRIRRTCSPRYTEHSIPECNNCHMSICLQGPDIEASHIVR